MVPVIQCESGAGTSPSLLRQCVWFLALVLVLTDTQPTEHRHSQDLLVLAMFYLTAIVLGVWLVHYSDSPDQCLPWPWLGATGVGRELLELLLSCRASAESASSSLTKLEFGAEERRCHWGDWVEVAES